jgi:ABC-2 type transport system ATP-binding protein
MNILEAHKVTKKYGDFTALNEVSITVKKDSVFGLLGPNGAGKTSLIRIINQITAPDSGEVFFAGERLMAKHVELIGYLPEERGLYRKMKVGEQALYLARLKGLDKHTALTRLK